MSSGRNAGGARGGRRARFGSRGPVAAAVVPAALLLAMTPGVEAAPSAPAQPRQAAVAAAPSRTWAPPTDVPGSIGGVGPLVTVGDRTAVAVWQSAAAGGAEVRAAQLAGGVWGSSMLVPNSTGMGGVDLAGDSQGRAIVAWRAIVPVGTGGWQGVRAADFDGSTWVTTNELVNQGSDQGAVELAMNPAGHGAAVWRQGGTNGDYLRGSFFSFPSATWGDHETLRGEQTGETVFGEQDVAVGPDGTTVAVWDSDDGSILAAWSKDSRTWKSVRLLDGTPLKEGRRPQVAVDGRGHAVAVWNEYWTGAGRYMINMAEFDGTSWTTGPLVGVLADLAAPKVAVNASGEAVVAWAAPIAEGQARTVAVRRRVAGIWQAVQSLANGQVDSTQVGIDDQGRALVLWLQRGSDTALTGQVEARAWEAGAWAAPVTVSGSGSSLRAWRSTGRATRSRSGRRNGRARR